MPRSLPLSPATATKADFTVVQINPNGTAVAMPTGNADGSVTIAGTDTTTDATAANPFPTRSIGSASIATSQVTVGTTNTQIVSTRAGRIAVTIENLGTGAFYVGVTGVTTANGYLVPGVLGATVTIPTSAAVFGIAAAPQAVSVLETF